MSAWPRIRKATGFDLEIAGDLRPARPPAASELAVLRSLDSLEVRKSEFSADELARTFTERQGPGLRVLTSAAPLNGHAARRLGQ